MKFESIDVQCYSGYKINETPRSFIYRNRRRTIVEIPDRWYEGGRDWKIMGTDFFKVTTDTGETFIIRYQGLLDRWSVMIAAE
ncbi:MAG: hypothetical protein JW884_12460 [Deltaproteobacteria bacterium]|nr:hypothetical protein [Deltaproteobacteria bacterium]